MPSKNLSAGKSWKN